MDGYHFQRTQFLSLDHDVSPSMDHKQLSLTGVVAQLGKCSARIQETLSSTGRVTAVPRRRARSLRSSCETQFKASLGCVRLYLKKENLNFIYLEKMNFSNTRQALLCLLFRFQGSRKCSVMRGCGV